jgi:hypothetical protein
MQNNSKGKTKAPRFTRTRALRTANLTKVITSSDVVFLDFYETAFYLFSRMGNGTAIAEPN